MKENIKFLIKIIEFCEEREGYYCIESDGNGKNELSVILGNQEFTIDTKDTEGLKHIWNKIEKYWINN